MAKKVARLLLTLAGAAVGVGLVALANRVITFPEGLTLYQRMLPWGLALVFVGSGTIIAIIFNILFAMPRPVCQQCQRGSCSTAFAV